MVLLTASASGPSPDLIVKKNLSLRTFQEVRKDMFYTLTDNYDVLMSLKFNKKNIQVSLERSSS